MRTILHKQKVTSALKNMSGENQYLEQNQQFKKGNQPSVSIINFNTFQTYDTSRDKQNKKINPLTTFSVPHTQHKSKILKFITQSSAVTQQTQEWANKLKSQRIRSFSFKNKSEHSQRIQTEPKAQKKKDQEKIEKEFKLSKKESTNKSQQSKVKKPSQKNIIESIRNLRKQQTTFTWEHEQPKQNKSVGTQNKRSKTCQSLLQEDKTSQLVENYKLWKNQQTLHKLKAHIKSKLSGRTYNTLKQRHQAFYKVTLKGRSLSNDKSKSLQSSQTMNQRKTINNFKQLQLRNFKSYASPLIDPKISLKIEPKTAQIVCNILKCKYQHKKNSQNALQQTLRIVNKNKTMNSFYQSSVSNPENNHDFQIKRQYIRQQNRLKLQKKCNGNNKQVTKQGQNLFRHLTPWHNDQYEVKQFL